MTRIVVTPEALLLTAGTLDRAAEQIRQTVALLDRVARSLDGDWRGMSRARFEAAWADIQHRLALTPGAALHTAVALREIAAAFVAAERQSALLTRRPPARGAEPAFLPFIQSPLDATDIDPNDMDQKDNAQGEGGIGDCYLIASLGAVAAANPDLIRNMISSNGDGTYDVLLYLDGPGEPPTSVRVSADALRDMPGATPSDGNEIWGPLIEQAYVKSARGHAGDPDWFPTGTDYKGKGVEGGWMSDAMELLTGIAREADIVPSDVGIERLRGYLDQGYAMTAATLSRGDVGGLANQHAYVVRDVDPARGLVTLWNPWGPTGPAGKDFVTIVTFEEMQRYMQVVQVNATRRS